MTSAAMRLTRPLSSGVVRWLKLGKRSAAGWPRLIWSIFCGSARTSERVCFRHDQHDLLARSEDGAFRMHRKLLHDAGLRSADLDPLQLIHRRDLAFDQFRDLGADVGQLLGDVAAQVRGPSPSHFAMQRPASVISPSLR